MRAWKVLPAPLLAFLVMTACTEVISVDEDPVYILLSVNGDVGGPWEVSPAAESSPACGALQWNDVGVVFDDAGKAELTGLSRTQCSEWNIFSRTGTVTARGDSVFVEFPARFSMPALSAAGAFNATRGRLTLTIQPYDKAFVLVRCTGSDTLVCDEI